MLYVFIGHVGLLVLAATNFTIVNLLLPSKHLTWNYYAYAWKNGFGYTYVSDYTLPQILAYVGAYCLGLIVYAFAWRRRWSFLGAIGIGFSAVGLFSFLFEASHWVIEHHRSCILSAPVIMVVLGAVWLVLFLAMKKAEPVGRGVEAPEAP